MKFVSGTAEAVPSRWNMRKVGGADSIPALGSAPQGNLGPSARRTAEGGCPHMDMVYKLAIFMMRAWGAADPESRERGQELHQP